MRFNRTPDHGPFEDTRRKRLALARKQRLEREKFPLLADQIAEQQPDADTVMAQRAEDWDRWQQANRDRKAAAWRRARAQLFAHGDNLRRVLRQLWAEAPYPAAPEYLLDMLDQYQRGRLEVDNPPWRHRPVEFRPVDLYGIIARARARQGLAPGRADD